MWLRKIHIAFHLTIRSLSGSKKKVKTVFNTSSLQRIERGLFDSSHIETFVILTLDKKWYFFSTKSRLEIETSPTQCLRFQNVKEFCFVAQGVLLPLLEKHTSHDRQEWKIRKPTAGFASSLQPGLIDISIWKERVKNNTSTLGKIWKKTGRSHLPRKTLSLHPFLILSSC